MCEFDKRDRKSDSFLKEVFNSSATIGVFKVIEVGPMKDGEGPLSSRYTSLIKFEPINVIKGKKEKHNHFYMGIKNNLPIPFIVGEKYLMAFGTNAPDKTTQNGACDWPFQERLSTADYFVKKFKQFKLEEKE